MKDRGCNSNQGLTKQCSDCRKIKPIEDFYTVKDKSRRAVRREPYCKSCKQKRRYKNNQKYQSEELVRNDSTTKTKSYLSSESDAYKTYNTPNGLVSFTKDDFDHIVRIFSKLQKWRDELKAQGRPTRTIELD